MPARRPPRPLDPLRTREGRAEGARELAAAGFSIPEIADLVGVTPATARGYLKPGPPAPFDPWGPPGPGRGGAGGNP